MLDIKYVIQNKDYVKAALAGRNGDFAPLVDKACELEEKRKAIIAQVEVLKQKRNELSKQVGILKRDGKDITSFLQEMEHEGDAIKSFDDELSAIVAELNLTLLNIPNLPNAELPKGKSDAENVVVRKFMEPTEFDFEPKAHWDIGENLKILDFAAAAKISGARFTVYRDLGARLERSIYNFMLDTHTQNGYTEVFPPYLVNRTSMTGTGQIPKFEEDMFAVKNTDYFLIPTAEVPVTNLLRDDIVDEKDLPIKYCAYTACFRAEAGSAGRDTRGLIRQHQFNKVELVKFTTPETSYAELEKLTNDAERILQLLKLPYRVSMLCTGDIGFCSAKTYDLEVYMPSYGRYVEISSCSNFENYQARRANIKYRNADKKANFVHTLNGSGLAVGRTVAAILENYQNADGSVTVPEVLRKYMGVEKIN